jgi:hypothetical protein
MVIYNFVTNIKQVSVNAKFFNRNFTEFRKLLLKRLILSNYYCYKLTILDTIYQLLKILNKFHNWYFFTLCEYSEQPEHPFSSIFTFYKHLLLFIKKCN